MIKKKLLQRIILTLAGIPLMLTAIFFFPYYNFALLFLLVLFFSVTGSMEMKGLMEKKLGVRMTVSPWLGLLFPVTAYVSLFLYPSFSVLWTVYLLFLLFVLFYEIIRGSRDDFAHSLTRTAMTLLMVAYPNLLTPYVIYMAAFEHASFLLMLFFLLVFSNDVFAYVFGMVFGRGTRGIVRASPNKSLAGFIGGTAMAVAVAIGYAAVFSKHLPPSQWWHMVILGILISASSNIGDLFESALKRSADVKDSGTIVPGRGGILDSIDSVIFSAPVFYYLIYILYAVN